MVFFSIIDYAESSNEEIDLATMNDLNDLVGKMEEICSVQAYSKYMKKVSALY